MSEISLKVNGRIYSGWQSVHVIRSAESIAGSFSLESVDRWFGQARTWAIREEDECDVLIDNDLVLRGHVDRRSPSFSATSRRLAYSGRSRAAVLVDCSAILPSWTMRNMSVLDVARRISEPYGISILSAAPEIEALMAPEKFVVNPGDSAFDTIDRLAKMSGVMALSTPEGDVVLTRAGTERATDSLVEGENILSASGSFDSSSRYHHYIVLSQVSGNKHASGTHSSPRGEATDSGVRRVNRTLLMRAATGIRATGAKTRADWEARMRAARADSVVVVVTGWRQSDGKLWQVNALTLVHSPTLGIDADMRISRAAHSRSSSGDTTELTLVRPDAFTPEAPR